MDGQVFKMLWAVPCVKRMAFVAVLITLGVPVRGSAAQETIAVFPFLVSGKPDPKIVGDVSSLLNKASMLIEQVKVLSGHQLKKALRKDPRRAIKKCGSQLTCIAKLGRRVRAKLVLLAKASRDGSGVVVSFLFINVHSKAIERKMKLNFASIDDVKPVLGSAFYALFGITTPGFLNIANAQGTVVLDGASIGKGEGPFEIPPGRHLVLVDGYEHSVMISPRKTRNISVQDGERVAAIPESAPTPAYIEEPTEVSEPEPESLASLSDTDADTMTHADTDIDTEQQVIEATDSTLAIIPLGQAPGENVRGGFFSEHLLTVIGGGAALVGVALIGVGAAQGVKAQSVNDRAAAEPVQTKAQKLVGRASAKAKRATLLSALGGAVVAVGATAVVVDMFVLTPKVYVTAGNRGHLGATMALEVAW